MDIRYTADSASVNWKDVSRLFKRVEWGERQPEIIESAFKRSSFVRFAYVENNLVGVGRTVDDGAYYGWIVDLAILPEYQGNGIGSYILAALERDLTPYITTMLVAAPGKDGFYEKLGWSKQSTAYIWPRSARQKRDFAE